MNTNEQVLDFIKTNPNSNKAAITTGTGIKGLPLFNLLKKLVTDGQITSVGEGNNATYSLNENYTEVKASEENAGTEEQNEQTEQPGSEVKEEVKEEQPGPILDDEVKKEEPVTKETTTKATTSRDNTKYVFEKEAYGKGRLVVAVLKKFVSDNPSTTYKQLADEFPPSLMKRFGVFEEIGKAKELSGTRDRYFFKPEDVITLGDKKKVVACSQWTAPLINGFIKVATSKEVGYKIK